MRVVRGRRADRHGGERRGELEQFVLIRPLLGFLEAGYRAWVRSRGQFNADLKAKGAEAEKQARQRHYVRGTTVSQERAPGPSTACLGGVCGAARRYRRVTGDI